MELSDVKKFQINKEWKTIEARTKRVAETMMLGDSYAKALKEKEFFLASIAIHSQILEHILKCLLEGYASRKRFLEIVDETDRFASVDLSNLGDKTLGAYIRILNRFEFTSKQELIELLDEFNSLRNKCVHHAFDDPKRKEFYETKAKEYLSSGSLGKIEEFLSSSFNELANEDLVITNGYTGKWANPPVQPKETKT